MRTTNTIYLRILISIIDQRKNILSIIAFYNSITTRLSFKYSIRYVLWNYL